MRIAWVLNLDADQELGASGPYAPTAAVLEKLSVMVSRIVGLVSPEDVVVQPGARAEGCEGRSWCPTLSAIARLRASGAREPWTPTLDVLRRANHRQLSAELGQGLPRAAYVEDERGLARVLSTALHADESWLLKRPFGFAGRARRKVYAGRLTGADRDFVAATLRQWGGLEAEPLVERRGDFGLHGFLVTGREVVLGAPTVQRCDAHGAWEGTERATERDLSPVEGQALERAAREAAGALQATRYFGPFGIDAYRYVDPETGALAFNARCEINARYSMGWAVGMGDLRPDREEH